MTEEIKTSQSSEASRQPANQATANTAGASVIGRPERKPLISWAALLDEAVKKPGFIHEAYSRFHNYSLGNQLLALFQCFERGIQPGPLATWPKWKELGRYAPTLRSGWIDPTHCTHSAHESLLMLLEVQENTTPTKPWSLIRRISGQHPKFLRAPCPLRPARGDSDRLPARAHRPLAAPKTRIL